MSGFAVVPLELQAAQVVLDDAAAEARAELDRLVVSARSLLGGGWHGSAAAAFTVGWDEWLAGAREVLAALDELGRAVGAAGRGYVDTDEGVRATFAGGAGSVALDAEGAS